MSDKKEKEKKAPREKRKPTKLEAISAIIFLLICFGLGAAYGLNYVPLMVVVGAYAAFIAKRCGYTWGEMEAAVGQRIGKSVPVITILLAIGFMLGGLMFSGTLPMLIYYGLQIVSPRWIALCAFLLCCIFSTVTGTSNGSASTAGLAMMGLAMAMDNVNLGLVAGACYAGSQFGDKLSPLSDTTVLASLTTDNDIFDHIAHMAKTVVPAAAISIIIYIIIGLTTHTTGSVTNETTTALLSTLSEMFKFNVILLIPVIFILWGSLTKKPTTLILFGSGFISILIGIFYQGFSPADGINVLYSGFSSDMVLAAHPNFNVETMSEAAKTLLERGGISDMNKTFVATWLCFYFAAIAELCGCLDVLLDTLMGFVHSTGSLILTTGISVVVLIMVGGSSTVALLLGGNMFKSKYEEMGVNTLNLSRTLEDFGTGCSGFFPWTSSGILYAGVLFSSNLTFLKYSFFSWIVWILAIFYAFTGIGMKTKPTAKQIEAQKLKEETLQR
ncbi:Na+/H+ antiporter NhaC [Oscillibacter sp. MSJ-2]|uniref:Na+/H+ antiporter NhaC n=1 Tax=Dysosmobacter acutus TaxID=2841504 RepID=A0ABS6F5V1_9FIRM|nr:Na+/H+ antiporter NhaC family protein [Dysosmobacter acutus]MBU5625542.1 Na+/H+ antiporter NhaC [Dysosmobacter acutus]